MKLSMGNTRHIVRAQSSGPAQARDTTRRKTALISGANTGIGFETAKSLLNQGYNVIIGCRDESKGQAAKKRLDEVEAPGHPGTCEVGVFDLARLSSVRDYSKRVLDEGKPIDILLNNAGVMACPEMRTNENFEYQFGVNHLGHFLLTHNLMPLVEAAAHQSGDARIINVASSAHYPGTIDFDDLQWQQKEYSKWGAYCQSKLANVMFSYELAKRVPAGLDLTVNALHPGVVATELGRYLFPSMPTNEEEIPWWSKPLLSVAKSFLLTPEQGAQTSIFLASSPDITGVSGKYFDSSKPKTSSKESYDTEKQQKLWEVSSELVNLR
jgi:NAD(P)-dependent dehydrogenase (short-subunit alcohol dehydrogenase family)